MAVDQAALALGIENILFLPRPLGLTAGIGAAAMLLVQRSDLRMRIKRFGRRRSTAAGRRPAPCRSLLGSALLLHEATEERDHTSSIAMSDGVVEQILPNSSAQRIDRQQPPVPIRRSISL